MHCLELHLDNFKGDFLNIEICFAPSHSRFLNSCISAKYCSILTNINGKYIYLFCELWGFFHRLILFLYSTNSIFYHPTLTLHLVHFEFPHFFISNNVKQILICPHFDKLCGVWVLPTLLKSDTSLLGGFT